MIVSWQDSYSMSQFGCHLSATGLFEVVRGVVRFDGVIAVLRVVPAANTREWVGGETENKQHIVIA